MTTLSDEQLNSLSKDALILIVASLQTQLEVLQSQLDSANSMLSDNNRQIELLTEQIKLMNQRHFGKKSEAGLGEMEGQLTIFDSFNEAEGFMQEGHSLNSSNPSSLKLPKLL